MSKITRLEQLENEDSLYRVVGLFNKSEICYIQAHSDSGIYLVSNVIGRMKCMSLTATGMKVMLREGTLSIMCLQRGNS
jgi:hypothetical protein